MNEGRRRFASWFGSHGVTVPRYLAARAGGDLAVERRFHEELLLRNGVYRTTREHRMDETFPLVIEAAQALPERPLRVLDVACSMGVATVELHRALRSAGIDCVTCGTDLVVSARGVRRSDGVALLFDDAGEVLQVDVGEWATPWRFRRSDAWFRAGLVARARRAMTTDLEDFRRALQTPTPGMDVVEVPLLHRSTEGVPGLRFARENLLEPRERGPFDLVRAANILNDDYFPPAVLRAMVEGLRARLVAEGALLVARNLTGESATRATLYRQRAGRLEVAAELHGGAGLTAID